jgi:hypothetical protein
MKHQDLFVSDLRGSGGLWHLPSVLMTVAAIGLIVLVNAAAPPPATTVIPIEAGRTAAPNAVEAHGRPGPRAAATNLAPAAVCPV